MSLYIIRYETYKGTTEVWPVVSERPPQVQDIVDLCVPNYRPDLGEHIDIHGPFHGWHFIAPAHRHETTVLQVMP